VFCLGIEQPPYEEVFPHHVKAYEDLSAHGTSRTSGDVRFSAAFGGQADVNLAVPIYEYTAWRIPIELTRFVMARHTSDAGRPESFPALQLKVIVTRAVRVIGDARAEEFFGRGAIGMIGSTIRLRRIPLMVRGMSWAGVRRRRDQCNSCGNHHCPG
jgi:hypothetical protein